MNNNTNNKKTLSILKKEFKKISQSCNSKRNKSINYMNTLKKKKISHMISQYERLTSWEDRCALQMG